VISTIITGLIIGASYVLIASGLTLIFGILDVINLAHGEVYMLGAFVALLVVTNVGLSFWWAFLISVIIVAIFGVVLEKLFFKPLRNKPHVNMLLVSIAVGILMQNLAMLIWGAEPVLLKTPYATQTVSLLGTNVTVQRVIVLVVGALLMIGLHQFIEKSKMGKAMRATAQDRDAAALMGINIDKVFSITFAIGCAFAAAAGTLIAPIFLVFPTMGATAFLKAFTVVIVGGLGNVIGAIYAGLLLGLVESLGAVYISSMYKDSFAFIILILVLLFKPSGLMGKE